ncbi:hypothetical protein PFISCL1PPCAC_11136, partial [Pristionchus fissidentatus]
LGVGRSIHVLNDEFVLLRSPGHSRDIDGRTATRLDKTEDGLDTVVLVVGRLHLECNLLLARVDELVGRSTATGRKRADGRISG